MDAAAVFDVDGTLCATSSSTSLVWLCHRQHSAWRHRLWLASLLWRVPLAALADTVGRHLADRMLYAQFAGLSSLQVEKDAPRCCEELLLPACFPDALAEVSLHRQAGRRVILLTGGGDVVLRPLAHALGAELLAQRLVAVGDRLTGAAKVTLSRKRSRKRPAWEVWFRLRATWPSMLSRAQCNNTRSPAIPNQAS
jgi:phosphoserine phosphatase